MLLIKEWICSLVPLWKRMWLMIITVRFSSHPLMCRTVLVLCYALEGLRWTPNFKMNCEWLPVAYAKQEYLILNNKHACSRGWSRISGKGFICMKVLGVHFLILSHFPWISLNIPWKWKNLVSLCSCKCRMSSFWVHAATQ